MSFLDVLMPNSDGNFALPPLNPPPDICVKADTSAKKDFTKHNWKGKNILLFGSEGFGIKAKTLENSDFRFKVNMNNNIESLNISNTVSVVCHHIYQAIK